jgi:hypothetical protein
MVRWSVRIVLAEVLLGASIVAITPTARAVQAATETIVLFRHGEKPAQGVGQLDCQGLRRALALPRVLFARFGRPDYLFAPNPAHRMTDYDGISYNYIRPLATIEPTAIRLSMPVNTDFGADQIDQLQAELLRPKYAAALIFVAWEHVWADRLAKDLVAWGNGDPSTVPEWPSGYDTLFIVQFSRTSGGKSVAFSQQHEGLDGLPKTCPE